MYTTHITLPTGPGKPPEYQMTQLGPWALAGSQEQFRQGATVFWNGRDLTKEWRDRFISAANKSSFCPSIPSSFLAMLKALQTQISRWRWGSSKILPPSLHLGILESLALLTFIARLRHQKQQADFTITAPDFSLCHGFHHALRSEHILFGPL